MKRLSLYILALFGLASCSGVLPEPVAPDIVELEGVETVIGEDPATKAASLDPENYVGRKVFAASDRMVITTMKRSDNVLPEFNYSDLVFSYSVAAGQTSGSWGRLEDQGHTQASQSAPERIFWSDAASNHTFIAYSLPQQNNGDTFSWVQNGSTYSGRLRVTNDVIDHSTSAGITADDLLLSYDTEKISEPGGSVAKLYFHHALANVRVVVNISGFSASNTSADTRSQVKDMVLENMLTKYHWDQDGIAAVADEDNVNKNTKLWIPRPEGSGSGSGKTFTFYCLAVPATMESLSLDFTVRYPDSLTNEMRDHNYSATIDDNVVFTAGYCTTINVSLNHQNEKITIGAEYTDWQFIGTPDEGELRKNDTFLPDGLPAFADRQSESVNEKKRFTIAGDPGADHRDATWLYKEPSDNKVYDIYGNDGTAGRPYTIKTAKQMLSFAYEVAKGNDGAGRSFTGQYVKLDANLTMQPDASGSAVVSWVGIGDASHPFDGVFLGGERSVTRLKGAALFHTIGGDGKVEQLSITSAGSGNLASVNRGTVLACSLQGDFTSSLSGTDSHAGGLVDDNQASGKIIASYHTGHITAGCNVGGIAGSNSGTIVASYSAGAQTCGSTCTNGGIVAYNSGTITSCAYNMDLLPGLPAMAGVTEKTTSQMQRTAFATEMTRSIPDDYPGHGFQYVPASYPKVR